MLERLIARLRRRSELWADETVSEQWLRDHDRRDSRISHGAEWRYGPVRRPHAEHGAMNRRLAGERGR